MNACAFFHCSRQHNGYALTSRTCPMIPNWQVRDTRVARYPSSVRCGTQGEPVGSKRETRTLPQRRGRPQFLPMPPIMHEQVGMIAPMLRLGATKLCSSQQDRTAVRIVCVLLGVSLRFRRSSMGLCFPPSNHKLARVALRCTRMEECMFQRISR
jgi:hypothetical protein